MPPPGDVLSIDRPEAQRVPVGMGITAPAGKIKELLDMPEVVKHREAVMKDRKAASQDTVLPTTTESGC